MHFIVFTAFESRILSNSWSQAREHERILSDSSCGNLIHDFPPYRTALVFLSRELLKYYLYYTRKMGFENKCTFNQRWFTFGLDWFDINKEMSFNNITGTAPVSVLIEALHFV